MHELCLALALVTAPSQQQPPVLRFENRSSAPYSGWVYATVPIPRGLVPDNTTLQAVTALDATHQPLPTVTAPLKWYWSAGVRTSIALAKLRTHLDLPPRSSTEIEVVWGQNSGSPFTWNTEILQWVNLQSMGQDVFLLARLQNDPNLWVARIPGELRTLERNAAVLVLRGRTQFVRLDDESIRHPLSLTTYWTLQSGENHGSVTFVLGNDTLDQPVAGGIPIADVLLAHRLPFLSQPKAPQTTGILGPVLEDGLVTYSLLRDRTLGDGQSYACDFSFCITTDPTSRAIASMQAEADAPIVGIADPASWRATRAAGPTGYVAPARFPTLDAGRTALEPLATMPVAGPADELGYINRNPPGTGDQPDFMAGIPLFYLQSIQTASSAPLGRAIAASRRECWRPSNYWDRAQGRWERASLVSYPELFFWSGRPHYDRNWNPQYPIWNTRSLPFQPGPFGSWAGMDNQHFGHNTLRSVYELTADPLVEDLLRANMSITYWNYFTDWMPYPEAERAGRIVKEALMLWSLFPDAPEAPLLRTAIEQKFAAYVSTATTFWLQYHVPAIAAIRDDSRVTLTQQFPGQDVHMSWQSGFHLEALTLASRLLGNADANALLAHYLDHANLLFVPDGMPKTYTLMSDPNQYTTGGIGLYWWNGWLLGDRRLPSNAQHALLNDFVKPLLQASIVAPLNSYWSPNDRWLVVD